MSNPHRNLPPEILDHFIDLLHDEPETLKQCCLVSKSWVPRTRRHLFADIKFRSASDLESWKKTFPDAANSPAYHARTLLVGCPQLVTASDAEEGGWIRTFSGLANLNVDNGRLYFNSWDSFDPFHRFAPTLKSLRMCPVRPPCPRVFNLICSFPLLEDLALEGRSGLYGNNGDSHGPRTIVPSTSPPLTGSLDLAILEGVGSAARQLLDFPNGLHFRKLIFLWDRMEDLQWVTELVATCSHSLESLDITYSFRLGLEPALLDLSKATKLRDLVFRPGSEGVEWITMTLKKITPAHRDLRQISVYVPYHLTLSNFGPDIRRIGVPDELRVGWLQRTLGEAVARWWSDLDCLLVQFWESRSIRPRVGCATLEEKGQDADLCIGCLLPEITRRGIIDLV